MKVVDTAPVSVGGFARGGLTVDLYGVNNVNPDVGMAVFWKL